MGSGEVSGTLRKAAAKPRSYAELAHRRRETEGGQYRVVVKCLGPNPGSALHCVSLEKSLHLSVSLFLHPLNSKSTSTSRGSRELS